MKRTIGEAKWSAECMALLNELLVHVFAWVWLVQPEPMGVVVVYPSLEGEACFLALTQLGPDKRERPIAFVARYLTKTEVKYGTLTTLVSVAAWVIR